MNDSSKIRRAQRILFVLEFMGAIEASFIIGLVVYLNRVIKLSYMLDIIRVILVISIFFLVSSVRGIYKYYKNCAVYAA